MRIVTPNFKVLLEREININSDISLYDYLRKLNSLKVNLTNSESIGWNKTNLNIVSKLSGNF